MIPIVPITSAKRFLCHTLVYLRFTLLSLIDTRKVIGLLIYGNLKCISIILSCALELGIWTKVRVTTLGQKGLFGSSTYGVLFVTMEVGAVLEGRYGGHTLVDTLQRGVLMSRGLQSALAFMVYKLLELILAIRSSIIISSSERFI